MLNNNLIALISCTLLLSACTVTGPADDGYDNSNEWVDNGTLLSEHTKTLYSPKENNATPQVEPEQASAVVLDEKAEFALFKKWDQLRSQGVESAEYREFLQWLKYQSFKDAQ